MSEHSPPADQDKNTELETRLIFLPGLHGTDDLFEDLLEELQRKISFQKILITYPNDIKQTYKKLTKWLVSYLEINEWSSESEKVKTIIIAESFSTVIALKLAEKFPKHIHGVVISGGFCSSPVPTIFNFIPLRPFFFIKPPLLVIRRYLTGSASSINFVMDVAAVLRKTSSKRVVERLRSILSLEEEQVPSIPATPVMLFQAEHDEVIPWKKQNQLEQHLQQAETHWLDSPHLIFQVHPGMSSDLILEFLDKI